ncbi:glyoxylase-like metal-dependent hydrolase (beta-lactamase superfamily II) [Kribbella sp. VKM Ac-2569]|uniref:N-acyl homoserine lactonase family protein n=1 Tax=Kribbella sp. VKM Ac-2569 TaxID=2512220 RepID=UPI00102B614D|nr:N-acyl homoserine lactonase family protein [Kribbella sp. VKM Ac-2569]RZT07600.1 glyoxylase-like metal-dependent hydrolase (beta-lactamase superfamily II) [Kribbella sp. VKM Ac-2569]
MSRFRVYAIRFAERDAFRGEHFHGYDARAGEPHTTAYYIWLAISDQHTVVIDTGIGPDRAAAIAGLRYRTTPVAALAALDVTADAVDHVVLTHLHYDHTGTARDFENATYVIQETEIDYWTSPWATRILRESWLIEDDDLAHLQSAEAHGRVVLTTGDATIVPGLSVHLVGGHTEGMQVVRLQTAIGSIVLASDASHFYENIEDDRPFPILSTTTGTYAAFDRIKQIADSPDHIVPGHDPLVLDRFPRLTPDIAIIAD